MKYFYYLILTIAFSFKSYCQEYEVYALKFGNRLHMRALNDVVSEANSADSVSTVYMFWLMKGENRLILVDAGFTEDAETDPATISFKRPDLVLNQLKIKPDQITDIIITHPHWDHIGGINLYPNARIWMQQGDYICLMNETKKNGGDQSGFNAADTIKLQEKKSNGLLNLIEGDNLEIIPGIRVYTGSKHTCESQFVKVNAGEKTVVIASDDCKYYYNLQHLLPIPGTTSAAGYVDNMKRMLSFVDNPDHVIPGHDILVFEKFEKIDADIVRIN